MIIINESIIKNIYIILNFDFFIVEEHRNIDCCMHLYDNKNLSYKCNKGKIPVCVCYYLGNF